MTYSGAILDVDGTVVRGEQALPGTETGLTALDSRSIRRLFVSNNPTRPPEAYAEKLRAADINAAPDEIITAATSTVEYLRRHHPDETVYLVGDPGVREQLERAGFDVWAADEDAAEAAEAADVAVVSIDRSFDYDTLAAATRTIRGRDLPIVGTDPDAVIPAAEGNVPGSGAMIAAVAGTAERDPDAVLGKPHEITRRLALERLDCDPAECLVIGDRLDTDIALGADAGMTTVLVRSGVTNDARLARSDVTPDYVIDSLADIAPVIDGVASQYEP
ncbi:HAD-IIA family hydrolase [Halolamina salifodinae]|uniref:4-nitrophenyl phosphatase n=1 Tax=Halolamina salifodinae TaxID=1202767 RepID=A0A8T4GXH7_9EURY|nr:HAD-IIA family hydrolase [Halolamina salifodinae]MBP1987150.1 4-nitrophenyl phosphatase [Halolamina salifodinae]